MSAPGFTHAELVARLQHMRNFARSLTGNRDAADDLVQEAAARALRAADRFEPGTNLAAWLLTIVRNTHYSALRTVHRIEFWEDEDLAARHTAPAAQDKVVEAHEVIDQVRALPDSHRALLARLVEGDGYEEIAAALDMPVGTVKSRIHRARLALLGRAPQIHASPKAHTRRPRRSA